METKFYRPNDQKEALFLLKQYGADAMIVNGGTDAVLQLTEKKVSPQAIIYISKLPQFHDITLENDSVFLGGAVTYREMLDSPIIQAYTGLIESILHLASPPIRELATPAGNICTAAPSADCTTMLLALRAKVHLASESGERVVELNDYYISTYKTTKRPDELVVKIELPALREGDGTGYCRLSRRKAQDIGKVLIGAYAHMEGERISDVSISLGALNAYVAHATELEQALIGKTADEALAYTMSVFPVEAKLRESYFKAYKQDTVCPAVTRALEMAIHSIRGGKE